MSNITTTINIDDPVGDHQRSQRLFGLATNEADHFMSTDLVVSVYSSKVGES